MKAISHSFDDNGCYILWTHFFVPYPDEEESEEEDDEGVDSKFFEEMAKPAFFNSSATSNCEETSTRETVNILPSTS
jgi:hypothetical protein